jgi:hypothetical protein
MLDRTLQYNNQSASLFGECKNHRQLWQYRLSRSITTHLITAKDDYVAMKRHAVDALSHEYYILSVALELAQPVAQSTGHLWR